MENLYFYATVKFHVILSILAFIICLVMFVRKKKYYHLVLAFALPATLLVYATKTQAGFSVVGLTVAVAMVGAVILEYTVDKDKETPKELTENPEDSSEMPDQQKEG
ncbi:MAG TPA: hypothetical protein DCO72_10155 [Ruminococcus sp.]|nr:hypothetical protein [Ruminococcus sp.]